MGADTWPSPTWALHVTLVYVSFVIRPPLSGTKNSGSMVVNSTDSDSLGSNPDSAHTNCATGNPLPNSPMPQFPHNMEMMIAPNLWVIVNNK